MSFLLQVTDGTLTVDLSTTLLRYRFQTPEGQENLPRDLRTVAEPAVLDLSGATLDLATAKIHNLRTLFEEARQWQKRLGKPVYLQRRLADGGTLERSEILDGDLDQTDDVLAWQLAANLFECNVEWTRRGWWETDSEVAVPLLNGSVGAKTTSALAIGNTTDGSNYGYVTIAAADVVGDIPSPVRLVFVNTAANETREWHIGHGWNGTPASYPVVLEGEAFDVAASHACATCSGGNYGTIPWAGGVGYVNARKSLSAAQVQACAGTWFHVFARFHTLPGTGLAGWCAITLPGQNYLNLTPLSALSTTRLFQDLGTLQVPPFVLPTAGALEFIFIVGNMSGTTAGSVDLDYIALLPTNSFRSIVAKDVGAVAGATFTIDEALGRRYITASAANFGHVAAFGSPILLYPGVNQMLVPRMVGATGDAELARTATLQAFYRPRRLTL